MYRKFILNNLRQFWKKSNTNYNIVYPGNVSEKLIVPNNILKPVYHNVEEPTDPFAEPEIKDESQIMKMRQSCKLASEILLEVGKQLKVGQTTDEIDKLIHKLCIENYAYPSPLNYKGFPKSVCTSVNNVICHGIPDDRPLRNGDIINIDITVFYNGYHGDTSKTFCIGYVDNDALNLIHTTDYVLKRAIEICKPGVHFCTIGNTIEYIANRLGYNVIPAFAGHGIGTYFHGPPDIFHCANSFPGIMKPGMTFTIEPALTKGSVEVVILEDGWTAVTADNARSAQSEHTILITDDGAEILTLK